MPLNPHLFAPPTPTKGESVKDYETRCYQNDVAGLGVLVGAVARTFLLADDLKQFRIFPQEFPQVVLRVSQLLIDQGFRNPGPFKKASALTASLIEHPVVMYRADDVDPILQWKLSIVLAAKITQLYLIKAFSDHKQGKVIAPPQWPSKHFMGDFLHYLMTRSQSERLSAIAMVWELLTYCQNPGPDRVHGIIDDECDEITLPGIDVPYDQAGSGMGGG